MRGTGAVRRLVQRIGRANVWVLIVAISAVSIAPLTVVEYSNSQLLADHEFRAGDVGFLGASVLVLLALQVLGLWVVGRLSGLRALSPMRERCVVVTGVALMAMLTWVAFEAARDPYAAFAFFLAPFAVTGIGMVFFVRALLGELHQSAPLPPPVGPPLDLPPPLQ